MFVPVSINYDRVLEDKVLLAAAKRGDRRFRVRYTSVLGFSWKLVRRQFYNRGYRFGHAAVVFGAPVAISDIPEIRDETPAETAAEFLMEKIAEGVPVLPVPLVSKLLCDGHDETKRISCRRLWT